MEDNAPFNIISALSCHNIPTQNHPDVPIKLNHKSNTARLPVDLHITADNINTLEIHFTYQDKSPLGVTFLKTLVEFNSLIFWSSFLNLSTTWTTSAH